MNSPLFRHTALIATLASALAGCSSLQSPSGSTLSGVAMSQAPLANADITVCDATGIKKTAKTDTQGVYKLDVAGMKAPLLVGVTNAPLALINKIPQPINGNVLYTALVSSASGTANVNPLTDKIASEVAVGSMGLKGSVQLFNACTAGIAAKASPAAIQAKTGELRSLLIDALKANKVSDADKFDPVTSAMQPGVASILATISHNRDGWGSGSDDQLRGTNLFDRNVQEISAKNVKLDPNLKSWSSYKTRIFVVGDSTASNYPLEVAPRMGWGQPFDRQIKSGADVKVVNLAQSGRSSRSFISEGWFKVLADNLQQGDFVLMQWGHNDEKCDVTGSLDWVNRCVYPNDASGKPRMATSKLDMLPPGVKAEDTSFQKSLEKYITLAKSKGASIALVTPVSRINQDKNIKDYVEGEFPIAKSTHITSKGDFPGDYSQTIRDAAQANKVALIDLDAKSMAFMNTITIGTGGAEATGGWRDYHLAVKDFAKYPYYKDKKTTGHYLNPDRTHFQEKGAVKVGDLIVEGIKQDQTGTLAELVKLLK